MGPGNCLIDAWVRKNKKGNFDKDGAYAAMGKTNDLMLNQALDNFDNRPDQNRLSFDTKTLNNLFLTSLNKENKPAPIILPDKSVKVAAPSSKNTLTQRQN